MKGKPRGKTTPWKLSLVEKKEKALRMRKAGNTYRVIGEELGCTEQRVWQIVNGELKRINAQCSELAEGMLRLELERLDSLWKETYDTATGGGDKAIPAASVCLKILERRAKMLGIDAPEKIAPTDPSGKQEFGKGVSNEDLEAFIRKERAKEESKKVKEEAKASKVKEKDGSFSRN